MAVANTFTFGGISSSTYNVVVEGPGDYSAPKRAVEAIEIPGRNGAFQLDKGYYENITVEYSCLLKDTTQANFETAVASFRNAIVSQEGYQRLTDTYHTNEYRMAVYAGGFDEDPSFHGKGAVFKLKFDCKPQRFLTAGETATADQAEEVCKMIREMIAEMYDAEAAEAVRIQYGGSMNAANAAELLSKPNIDGGLIGGASLKPDFGQIVNA